MKSSARRTTAVGDDPNVVVKVFHSRGLRRLRDRSRARRELAFLERLHGDGLTVPRPRVARRVEGDWVLEMDRVPDAVPLASLAEGSSSSDSRTRRRIARNVGRLAARLASAGVEHRDLHPGNFLVGPADDVWLVDFARAVQHRAFDRDAALRDLVAVTAAVRETTSPRERSVAFAAWRRELRTDAAAELPPAAELAAAVERAARVRRREVVLRHLGRWTRESGVAHVLHEWPSAVVEARGHGLHPVPSPRPGAPFGFRTVGAFEVLRATPADVRRAWSCAARLFEHRVPTFPPVRMCERQGWATFARRPRHGAAATPAELAATLRDRGLAVPRLDEHVARLEDGRVVLRPTATLRDDDGADDAG